MITPLSLVIGSWTVFIVFWAISAFNVKRDRERSRLWRSVLIRLVLVALVFAWLVSTSRMGLFTSHVGPFLRPSTSVLAWFGAALCVLGIALAVWARVHLGRNWSSMPALKEGHELVTSGPYRLVRHPIYTGVMMAIAGSAIMEAIWLLVCLGACVMFVWRVKAEEALMMQEFPDQYPEYKKHTWALIPYIW